VISVTLHRDELTRHDACDASMPFFEWLRDAQGRDDSVRVREWTPLHSLWLAVVRLSDAEWLTRRGLIPGMSGANLSGANLSGAYYPTGDLPNGWARGTDGYLMRAT
jgi:hypothetical protein